MFIIVFVFSLAFHDRTSSSSIRPLTLTKISRSNCTLRSSLGLFFRRKLCVHNHFNHSVSLSFQIGIRHLVGDVNEQFSVKDKKGKYAALARYFSTIKWIFSYRWFSCFFIFCAARPPHRVGLPYMLERAGLDVQQGTVNLPSCGFKRIVERCLLHVQADRESNEQIWQILFFFKQNFTDQTIQKFMWLISSKITIHESFAW